MEDGWQFALTCIVNGLADPVRESKRFLMFCLNMDMGKSDDVSGLPSISAILSRTSRIVTVVSEVGCELSFIPGSFLLTVYLHGLKPPMLSCSCWPES